MRKMWARLFSSECAHDHTLVVRSVGVQRKVCEGCGHVSFSIATTLLINANQYGDIEHHDLPHASGL